ncbi:MAG TPA: (Fe-S)-binding protein [Candidatus Hydrogenedentes bacterium]|nr:(Fe-S)-binding protein [Candidatus Hydrogenedentota bacterium]
MALDAFDLSAGYAAARCEQCGECLRRCPVLRLPEADARREMAALAGGQPSVVLERCTGCMGCNSYCPNGANPHSLILERWHERYRAEGIPRRGALVLPYQKPNLYTRVIEALPPDERDMVAHWEANWRNPPDADTMVYAGCNSLIQPYLLDSRLFDEVPIFGSTDLCCGEPYYRMGCLDAARSVALHVRDEFARMGMRRVITPCLGGYHLFRAVYPEVFGVKLSVEVVSQVDWILERMAAGELRFASLHKRAVLHDNCWPKASGDVQFDATRELLTRLGVEVVEPAHTREDALCCGMCACAARFSLRDVVRAARQRLKELDAADADMTIDYCGGCNWLLGLVNRIGLSRAAEPIYHLSEVVQMALGEMPKHNMNRLSKTVMRVMAARLGAAYTARGRFWVKEILGEPVEEIGQASNEQEAREGALHGG